MISSLLRNGRFAAVLIPCLLVFSPPGQAEPQDLAAVVSSTLQQHPEYRLGATRQALAERVAERTDNLLAGDAAVSLRHKNDSLASDKGLSEWGAGVELPLWLPGQKDSYRSLAQGLSSEAVAGQRLLAWQVAGEIRERAWALRLAQTGELLAREQLQSAQALEQEVAKRRAAGELADADWVLAREETLSREALLQQAGADVALAVNAWRAYTGLTQLPQQLVEQPAQDPDFPDNHPQLLSASGKVQTSMAERQRERIERRANPMLSLSANHERADETTDYDNSLELTITLPLGSRSQAAPRLARAELNLTEAESSLALAKIQLNQEWKQAKLEMEQTAAASKLAEERKTLTARGEHLARRAFELGESDLVQLLRARNQAADAALNLQRRQLEHQRAIARYNQILGVLPQ